MTAPAPRNHPAEDAHPAPTPAPVAVPEVEHYPTTPVQCSCGWREGDPIARTWVEHFRVTMAPRPEPVVAPLPSEAPGPVVLDRDGDAWQRGPEGDEGWWCTAPVVEQNIPWERLVKEFGPLRRMVPEDDEDTVRVPRKAWDRFAADVTRLVSSDDKVVEVQRGLLRAYRDLLEEDGPQVPREAAEDDMCPNCLTPWKCNGPHMDGTR